MSTQTLVNVDPKSAPPAASALTITVGSRKEALDSWVPVVPAGAQIALLIDDGLRESVGRELNTLRAFVGKLPPGIEVLVGYMQNGRVIEAQPFTTDHAAAAASLHLPEGMRGASASPYFCLSDFVKKWPAGTGDPNAIRSSASHKARFVLMITNGVDPYNGSTNIMNQDSPYVETAISDAQRAGVAVYSIYYADAGIRGGQASFSGQSYLAQLAQGTGGVNYYEGSGNPVSMSPFLAEFQTAVAETYVATFAVPAGKDMVRLKVTSQPKAKLRAPDEVRPGNQE